MHHLCDLRTAWHRCMLSSRGDLSRVAAPLFGVGSRGSTAPARGPPGRRFFPSWPGRGHGRHRDGPGHRRVRAGRNRSQSARLGCAGARSRHSRGLLSRRPGHETPGASLSDEGPSRSTNSNENPGRRPQADGRLLRSGGAVGTSQRVLGAATGRPLSGRGKWRRGGVRGDLASAPLGTRPAAGRQCRRGAGGERSEDRRPRFAARTGWRMRHSTHTRRSDGPGDRGQPARPPGAPALHDGPRTRSPDPEGLAEGGR